MSSERAGEIAELHCSIFPELKETKKGFRNFLSGNRFGFCSTNGRGLVNGYVIGTIGGAGACLNWIAVRESSRGAGLGSKLLKAFEKESVSRGGRTITLDTKNSFKDAIKLYLDHGYNIFGCQLAGNSGLLIRMSKPLGK